VFRLASYLVTRKYISTNSRPLFSPSPTKLKRTVDGKNVQERRCITTDNAAKERRCCFKVWRVGSLGFTGGMMRCHSNTSLICNPTRESDWVPMTRCLVVKNTMHFQKQLLETASSKFETHKPLVSDLSPRGREILVEPSVAMRDT
ncbi:hypothetical protein L9F63_023462, partial [Diploptera punctata]